MTGSAALVAGSGATSASRAPSHWMQLDQPDRVNALLLDFLA